MDLPHPHYRHAARRLSEWAHALRQDHGTVISTELLCVATIAIVGLVVALTSLRDAAISELSDVAGAVQDFNQCYSFNPAAGHSATTHGSSFLDATDHCDEPGDVAGAIQNCIVFSDPEDEDSGPLVSIRVEAESDDVETTTGGPTSEGWIVWSNGQLSTTIEIPEDGNYWFFARLWGSHGGPDLPNAALLVDGVAIDDFDIVPTSFATAETYHIDVTLPAGSHDFAVEFTNDFYMPPIDRNLFVDWLEIVGPD